MKTTFTLLSFVTLLTSTVVGQDESQYWIQYFNKAGCATDAAITYDVFQVNSTCKPSTCQPVCPFCDEGETVAAVDVLFSASPACLIWFEDSDCTNEVGRFQQASVNDPSCAAVPANVTGVSICA
ncbi:hypothetical protein BT69DRAFT_1277657 [Atractiella rhizophila]|nr:hypothetical protein BT69DRAFT_1350764 [Atractiella rhizophila]KAH8927788.1 hypothetical protein BT69DRAFT_1277657 [Atractiella rhizophila]